MTMITFLAALPLVIFIILVLVAKRTVLFSAITAFIAVIAVALSAWGVDPARIASASVKGIFHAADIAFIVFGSIMIFEALRKKDLFVFIKNLFESISSDRRVHIVLVAWALVYFLEGVAGFGTPIIIAAPILVVLGFSPLTAVALSLMGDAVPDIFGAIGLPVTLGLGSVLSSIGADPGLLREIAVTVSAFNIIGSVFILIIMLFVFAKMEKKPLSHVIEFIPFAVAGGLVTTLTSFATAYFIGPDLPAVIGGFVALVVITIMARHRFLMPKTEQSEAMGPIPRLFNEKVNTLKAISPYIIALALLLVSRLPFAPIKNFFTGFLRIDISELFGFAINYSFAPLYAAGILLIISAAISMLIMKLKAKEMAVIAKEAGKKTWIPFVSLAFVLMFVQTYVYTSDNSLGLPSMLADLGNAAAGLLGSFWPLIAPFVGTLGSFTVGSTTVSNLIFTGLQYETAILSGFSPVLILTLQSMGAAAGGMIAFNNVLPALAVVGLLGSENAIVRRNMPALFVYLGCIIILGFAMAAFI